LKDYYIAEGVVEGGEEEGDGGEGEDDGKVKEAIEEKGTGVNKYTYFVANDAISGEWTKLPDLAPSQIESARLIKVCLTGDLDKKIYSNPFFYGQEKHYLRA